MKNLTEDYLQDVLVRLAHHSSAIEGNTISLADTVSILVHNTIPGKTSRREFYEIENHREAFRYVIEKVTSNEELSTSIIKDIHEYLTDRLQHDRGQFKTSDNAILGADFKTASPGETPVMMEQWVGNLNYQLQQAKTNEEVVRIVSDFHIQFERIHPFSDGNGRTGRMLITYSLLSKGIAPLIIKKEDKAEYVRLLSNQDVDAFSEFASRIIEEEELRIMQFKYMDSTQIKSEE